MAGRRSCLWSASVVATVAACGAFLYFTFPSETTRGPRRSEEGRLSTPGALTEETCVPVCGSKECVYQAKQLLDYVESGSDPCSNFHRFACGRVSERENPERQSHVAMRYSRLMALRLRAILESLEADPSTGAGKMKMVYDTCMRHGSSDLVAVPTLLSFLRGVGIPGWPRLDPDFRFVGGSRAEVFARLLSHQEYAFVEFHTRFAYMFREDEGAVNATLLEATSTYEDIERPKRKYLVGRILGYFDLDAEDVGVIWEETEALHDAVKDLKQEERNQRGEEDYSPDNVMDCAEDPDNTWAEACGVLASLVDATRAEGKVSERFADFQGSSHVVRNIFPLLRNFSDRSVAHYLALNAFLKNLNALGFYFGLSRDRADLAAVEPAEPKGPRWTKCVDWISRNMAMALGHEYLKRDFTVPLIRDVLSLTEECVRAAARSISRQEWLTEEERTKVEERVLETEFNLDTLVGTLTNETRMNLFYEQFHPTDENFFQNVLEYKRIFRIMDMHGSIAFDDRRSTESIFEPNARGGGSSVDILLGLLMPPTYTPRLQRYMNLVSFGLVLSHEIGHTMENSFRYLTNQSKYYEEKYKCLENQYSQFVFETIGKNMNASGRYRKENFADNIAISVIDKIIKKYASDNSSALMPSLSNSLTQQLYINSAHMWCSVHTKESDEWNYNFSTHSADRFRILGMMQNSRGFSEAFGCANGSYMNPSTKCLFLHDTD